MTMQTFPYGYPDEPESCKRTGTDADGIYTPDDTDARDEYVLGIMSWSNYTPQEAREQWARWKDASDREVRAKAYEYVAEDSDNIGGWAISELLTDLAAMERGQMTKADLIARWGR